MELTDISLPKKSKQAEVMEVDASSPEFPSGLELRFEKDQVKVLPSLKTFKVGDYVSISAEACVTMVRQSNRQNGDDEYTVELQIEKIKVDPMEVKPVSEMSPREYRSMREGKIIV